MTITFHTSIDGQPVHVVAKIEDGEIESLHAHEPTTGVKLNLRRGEYEALCSEALKRAEDTDAVDSRGFHDNDN